jgi:hypothetical protein
MRHTKIVPVRISSIAPAHRAHPILNAGAHMILNTGLHLNICHAPQPAGVQHRCTFISTVCMLLQAPNSSTASLRCALHPPPQHACQFAGSIDHMCASRTGCLIMHCMRCPAHNHHWAVRTCISCISSESSMAHAVCTVASKPTHSAHGNKQLTM